VQPCAGSRSANPITRPILPSGIPVSGLTSRFREQWGLDKVNTRCGWTGVVTRVSKQYTIFLLIRFRFGGPHSTGHFWPAGYGLQTPAVANKLAVVFLYTTPSVGASKNFQSIFWNILLLPRSEVEISFQRWGRKHILETMYSSWCSCDWGLRGTVSFLLSTCQTYYKKRIVWESRILH